MPEGVENTFCPDDPVAVTVSVAFPPPPQTFGVPPPPQVWGALQLPQVSAPPHPSVMLPQFLPWAAQVVGVHATVQVLFVQV